MEWDEELLGVQRNAVGPPLPLPFTHCAGCLCTAHPTAGYTNSSSRGGKKPDLKKTKPEYARGLNLIEQLIKIVELLLALWLQLYCKWLG